MHDSTFEPKDTNKQYVLNITHRCKWYPC